MHLLQATLDELRANKHAQLQQQPRSLLSTRRQLVHAAEGYPYPAILTDAAAAEISPVKVAAASALAADTDGSTGMPACSALTQ